MKPLPSYAVWLVVAACGVGWGVTYTQQQRQIGAAQVVTAQAKARADSLEALLAPARNKLAVDTVKIIRRVQHTDTLLQRLIDTALVHHTDTVTVRVETIREVQASVLACRETLSECGRVATMEKQRADALKAQIVALKKLQPSVGGQIVRAVLWGGVGYAVGRLMR